MPLCSPPTADCEFFNATSWLLRSPWQQATLFLSAKAKKTLPQESTTAQKKSPTAQTQPFADSDFFGEAFLPAGRLVERAPKSATKQARNSTALAFALYAASCEWLDDRWNEEREKLVCSKAVRK
jgi:hypothetical protein